ncbi:yippee zinc-binding/DNA-binding /Mis18, centromere assembly-domain-containing protein [Mycotypha africana]|uniref:yippee zinc-binding/DNA-binding /Mis18, centromere assembly-domain-containing protein n=1 Tax=Mycotypha africana TaxID=64632 RepID=UPI00230125EE|nr:yippee zinc-binding/DNA-binding /Mis18, centromere assembly-domain-containing protein [Mycotypha africana]KAI8991631.1 yippee zinc-binding/DNA-binding /Mis18, centromere assembly-domain-containing protein [Mycotypha africana]
MGLKIHPEYFPFYQKDLDGHKRSSSIYCCCTCQTHIASQEEIISGAYLGRHGPAYLVNKVLNITVGHLEQRMLMTGIHTVADLFCSICQMRIGWRYIKSPTLQQKYKEGRYLIEKTRVIKEKLYL